jgi:phage-related protein (TIGR01555 family)
MGKMITDIQEIGPKVETQGLGKMIGISRLVKFMDGWMNVLTGMNTKNHDARTSQKVCWNKISEADMEHLYAGDGMAARVVDLIVDASLSRGWKITGVKPEQEDAILVAAKKIKFSETISCAAKKARLYGGCAVVKVYNDSLKLDQPKEEGREIVSLIPINRFDMQVYWEDVQKSILSPMYNQPVFYRYMGGSVTDTTVNARVHHSRVVRFDGLNLPDEIRKVNQWWGDSILARCYDPIRNYAHAHDGVNAALKDLSVAVFKLRGLADLVSADSDEKLQARLNTVNLGKSILRAVVIDSEGEDFEYKTRTLTGAVDLVNKAEDRLATETGIPRTVLFGQSPVGGLGQSGNHESENWYSTVEAFQTDYLKPKMQEILVELAQQLKIPSEELCVEFNPLWQASGHRPEVYRHGRAEHFRGSGSTVRWGQVFH